MVKETAVLGPPYHEFKHKTNITWRDVSRGCRYLINRLDIVPAKSIYAHPRGGLVAACILAYGLRIERIYTEVPSLKQRKTCLVVEDFCDTGMTYQILRDWFPTNAIVALCRREGSRGMPNLWAFTIKHKEWITFPWGE